jgi:hypothetical protein
MQAALQSIKSAGPSVGTALAGWPWWAVAVVLVASCGSSWVMGWLDVIDRVRALANPAEHERPPDAGS